MQTFPRNYIPIGHFSKVLRKKLRRHISSLSLEKFTGAISLSEQQILRIMKFVELLDVERVFGGISYDEVVYYKLL